MLPPNDTELTSKDDGYDNEVNSGEITETNAPGTLEGLGPVDPRNVIYVKTRLRTPSTDLSSRRPKRRKKCTRKANCFNGRHPGTSSTFPRGPCVFSNHKKATG
ncbi:uncharacterized protein TNCV_539011 [Trichonephila clavipes]|nr:uncharacterized protein TNCV_539011 [Trichonephila clavipes]